MQEGFARVADLLDQLRTTLLPKLEIADYPGSLLVDSGQVNTLGNNVLHTPASGKKIRVYYASYNPLAAVECAFRFGASGTLWLRNNLTANSVIAKDFGELRYVEGGIDVALILNLSAAVNVIWNILYKEI